MLSSPPDGREALTGCRAACAGRRLASSRFSRPRHGLRTWLPGPTPSVPPQAVSSALVTRSRLPPCRFRDVSPDLLPACLQDLAFPGHSAIPRCEPSRSRHRIAAGRFQPRDPAPALDVRHAARSRPRQLARRHRCFEPSAHRASRRIPAIRNRAFQKPVRIRAPLSLFRHDCRSLAERAGQAVPLTGRSFSMLNLIPSRSSSRSGRAAGPLETSASMSVPSGRMANAPGSANGPVVSASESGSET